MLHRKQKGCLGELKVIEDLILRGYEVFTEFGDNSRVDLIALINKKAIRIQVKSTTSNGDSVLISAFKTGPNYKFRYELDDADLFAIYILDKNILFYLKPDQLLRNKTGLRIRLTPTKSGQLKKINHLNDFSSVLDDTIIASVA